MALPLGDVANRIAGRGDARCAPGVREHRIDRREDGVDGAKRHVERNVPPGELGAIGEIGELVADCANFSGTAPWKRVDRLFLVADGE